MPVFSELARGVGTWRGDLFSLAGSEEVAGKCGSPGLPIIPQDDPLHRHGVTVSPRVKSAARQRELTSGQLALPKTFVTRKGALVLFTAPEGAILTEKEKLYLENAKKLLHNKKYLDYVEKVGSVSRLAKSVLIFGEEDYERENTSITNPDNEVFLKFLHSLDEGTVDLHAQPGGDVGFYLQDLQTRAASAASRKRSTLSRSGQGQGRQNSLLTANAESLVDQFVRPVTPIALKPPNDRSGSAGSSSSQRSYNVLSADRLTASLKSANHLGRSSSPPQVLNMGHYEESAFSRPVTPASSLASFKPHAPTHRRKSSALSAEKVPLRSGNSDTSLDDNFVPDDGVVSSVVPSPLTRSSESVELRRNSDPRRMEASMADCEHGVREVKSARSLVKCPFGDVHEAQAEQEVDRPSSGSASSNKLLGDTLHATPLEAGGASSGDYHLQPPAAASEAAVEIELDVGSLDGRRQTTSQIELSSDEGGQIPKFLEDLSEAHVAEQDGEEGMVAVSRPCTRVELMMEEVRDEDQEFLEMFGEDTAETMETVAQPLMPVYSGPFAGAASFCMLDTQAENVKEEDVVIDADAASSVISHQEGVAAMLATAALADEAAQEQKDLFPVAPGSAARPSSAAGSSDDHSDLIFDADSLEDGQNATGEALAGADLPLVRDLQTANKNEEISLSPVGTRGGETVRPPSSARGQRSAEVLDAASKLSRDTNAGISAAESTPTQIPTAKSESPPMGGKMGVIKPVADKHKEEKESQEYRVKLPQPLPTATSRELAKTDKTTPANKTEKGKDKKEVDHKKATTLMDISSVLNPTREDVKRKTSKSEKAEKASKSDIERLIASVPARTPEPKPEKQKSTVSSAKDTKRGSTPDSHRAAHRGPPAKSSEEQEVDKLEKEVADIFTKDGADGEEEAGGLTAEEMELEQKILQGKMKAAEERMKGGERRKSGVQKKDVKKGPEKKSKKKKEANNEEKEELARQREALREARKQEKLKRLAEAKQLEEQIKQKDEERRQLMEEADQRKQELQEEIQCMARAAAEARQAEEDAKAALAAARKTARQERDERRKAELERRKQEAQRRREEEKKLMQAAQRKERQMLASIGNGNQRRRHGNDDESETGKSGATDSEDEEAARLKEKEEEERFAELERQAEEEAMAQLVAERQEAEQKKRELEWQAAEMRKQEERRKQELLLDAARLEEERRLRAEEEYQRQELERQRLMELKQVEEQAKQQMKDEMERRRQVALHRRSQNMDRRSHLEGVRHGQGVTRSWVFSYYVHWPRETYEKLMGGDPSKKKGFRPGKKGKAKK